MTCLVCQAWEFSRICVYFEVSVAVYGALRDMKRRSVFYG